MRFLVGGYTADMGGSATGIGMLIAGAAVEASAGGQLAFAGDVARAESPSWIAAHPTLDVVYAALEKRGVVQAFRRAGEESWLPLGEPVPAGEAVCHVAVAPSGGSIVAGCWGDGRVVRMMTDAPGRPSAPVIADAAVDPYGSARVDAHAGDEVDDLTAFGVPPVTAATRDDAGAGSRGSNPADLAAAARALRAAAGAEFAHLVPEYDEPGTAPGEEGAGGEDAEAGRAGEATASVRSSRAHQAVFLPGGLLVTTDLGFDLVRFWRAAAGAGLREVQQVVLPRGSGPRHLVWHPSGHLYVVTELSCEVFVLARDATGAWRIRGGVPIGALPGDAAAEIALARDGAFVYVGVRGSDTIATLRVRGAGDVLEPVALVDAGVAGPRHHLVVRDILLVAGQRSGDVASLTLDIRAGLPGRVRHRTAVPSPTCLLPLR